MKTSKGIILDIGNVLVTVNMDAMYDGIVKTGIVDSPQEAEQFMRKVENINNAGLTDLATSIDMFLGWKRTRISKFDYNQCVKSIVECWLSPEVIRPNKMVLAFMYDVVNGRDDITVALASNMGRDHFNLVRDMHPFFRHPRLEHFCSCNLGHVKPQFSFFHILSGYLQPMPKIYVDDREDNRRTAAKVGWETFAFDSTVDPEKKFIQFIESKINSKE